MIIHLPKQEIDKIYKIRDEMEKLMGNFLFMFNRSAKATILISSDTESMNVIHFNVVVKYFTEKGEERERTYRMKVFKFFRGKYDEFYFVVERPSLDTFFLLEALVSLNIPFEVFEGNIDEATWNVENYEEKPQDYDLVVKDRITLSGFSMVSRGVIDNMIVENKIIPLSFTLFNKRDMFMMVLGVNINIDDPLESLDLYFMSKLSNSRMFVYRDDYKIADYVQPEKQRIIKWKTTIIRFEHLV